MEPEPKRRGRPPEGLGTKDEPGRIRDYPRLLFTMRPTTKAKLKTIAEYENRSEWRIVDEGIAVYLAKLAPKDRRAIEAILKESKPQTD